MGNRAYYNEIDPYAAEWLRNLIKAKHIPDGDVDERSIVDVQPMDIADYTQCHFFAGIAGWSLALRLAGWPDDRPVWTGSCPCQPFSVAGKGKGTNDERHLWPVFFKLITKCKPSTVFGEQVASRAGREWLAGVFADLEDVGYAAAGADLCAASVGAPHIRQRLYWVANAHRQQDDEEQQEPTAVEGGGRPDGIGRCSMDRDLADATDDGCGGGAANFDGGREAHEHGRHDDVRGERVGPGASVPSGDMANADDARRQGRQLLPECADKRSPWSRGVEWRRGADGKTRRVKSGVRLLVDGVPNRVGRLRGYGNAIVPQVAAAFISAAVGAF